MQWYYAVEGRQIGPVSDEEFARLVAAGTVTAETLVWKPGMTDWQPYGSLSEEAGQARCAECRMIYPEEEMIRFGNSFVCADCKDIFFQKVREGVVTGADLDFAGFWIRAGAKFIDWIVMWVVQAVLSAPLAFLVMNNANEALILSANVAAGLIQVLVLAAYTTFFLGRWGATIGKMACGLKVVRPDGDRITYLRALGRHFAEMLSAMILFIGYIMAGFDEEKRTLHDRICDTRVIRKR